MTNKRDFAELTFSSYVREYHVIEKDLLYHPLAHNKFDEFHRKRSTVYMIVKTKRIAFIPESFYITGNFCICGDVVVGSRRETVVFNVAKFLFQRSGVCDRFSGWEEWAETVMSSWRIQDNPEVLAAEAYRRFSSIDIQMSTGEYLCINCKLWQSIANGNVSLRTIVSPVQLAHFFDWSILEPLDVLYVGKSTDGVLNRARNHNKWGKITTDLPIDEFAVVYFMDLETKSVVQRRVGPFISVEEFKDKEIGRSSEALIMEAALIKHFFDKKGYNEMIVNQNFKDVSEVKEKLLLRGYAAVCAELRLEGVFGNVGTAKTGYHSEHAFFQTLRDL